jgi:hypothetical protein
MCLVVCDVFIVMSSDGFMLRTSKAVDRSRVSIGFPGGDAWLPPTSPTGKANPDF